MAYQRIKAKRLFVVMVGIVDTFFHERQHSINCKIGSRWYEKTFVDRVGPIPRCQHRSSWLHVMADYNYRWELPSESAYPHSNCPSALCKDQMWRSAICPNSGQEASATTGHASTHIASLAYHPMSACTINLYLPLGSPRRLELTDNM